MIPLLQDFETVVLANGSFPTHSVPLSALRKAKRIVCCDDAAANLLNYGLEPSFIAGDMDSLSPELKERFAPIIFPDPDQETNDLTKAMQFCEKNGWFEITILGATGKREDHSIANLSLLADYGRDFRVQLLTDYGIFVPQYTSEEYESYPGQQVSLFSLSASSKVTTHNLRYPIHDRSLLSWWEGTLNEAVSDSFEIRIDEGRLLIFREYERNS